MDPGPQAQKQKLSLIIIPSVPLQHLTLPVLTALGSAGLNVLVHGRGGHALDREHSKGLYKLQVKAASWVL